MEVLLCTALIAGSVPPPETIDAPGLIIDANDDGREDWARPFLTVRNDRSRYVGMMIRLDWRASDGELPTEGCPGLCVVDDGGLQLTHVWRNPEDVPTWLSWYPLAENDINRAAYVERPCLMVPARPRGLRVE